MIRNMRDGFEIARERMVERQIIARGVRDERVIKAMKKVPRHLFTEKALYHQAYNDYPLAIGEKQTISQPYIVAVMTESLNLKGGEKVLEIGTGSGYQAAVLAELVYSVYSIERISVLAKRAKDILQSLNYYNVFIKIGDGTEGWQSEAPFDGILVTAASPDVPQKLKEQLKDGGRLVIPVGNMISQNLLRVTRRGNRFVTEDLLGCRFVPLIGRYGFQNEL
jgi:protein-L-isoaspartate(D-aspartate) O-methyltransferase